MPVSVRRWNETSHATSWTSATLSVFRTLQQTDLRQQTICSNRDVSANFTTLCRAVFLWITPLCVALAVVFVTRVRIPPDVDNSSRHIACHSRRVLAVYVCV